MPFFLFLSSDNMINNILQGGSILFIVVVIFYAVFWASFPFLLRSSLEKLKKELEFDLKQKYNLYERMMEMRKDKYSEVSNLLAGFFDTATLEKSTKAKAILPDRYRDFQIWASDDVLRRFTALIKSIDKKSGEDQGLINAKYQEMVVAMRKDLLDKTDVKAEDIYVVGKIG